MLLFQVTCDVPAGAVSAEPKDVQAEPPRAEGSAETD